MFLELFIASSTLIFAGSQLYKRRQRNRLVYRLTRTPLLASKKITSLPARRANQALALSSLSLGLATFGALSQPILSLVSIPFVLYIFIPTYQSAYITLRQEHRITTTVLDALRISVCVVMGYYFAAALNACLQTASQRLLIRSEDKLQDSLNRLWKSPSAPVWLFRDGVAIESIFEQVRVGDVLAIGVGETIPVSGKVVYGSGWVDQCIVTGDPNATFKEMQDTVYPATIVVSGELYIQAEALPKWIPEQMQETLQQTVENRTGIQKLGESSSDWMSPQMMLSFLIGLPFFGTNRSAAFLCTSFGGHMRSLGPLALWNFANLMAQLGILIKDGHALEKLNLVNTIVFDARVISDPAIHEQLKPVIRSLRQRKWPVQRISKQPFAIYLLTNRDEEAAKALASELGMDDIIIAPFRVQKSVLIENLQKGGRSICYIGDGIIDAAVMKKATVSVSVRGDGMIAEDAAPLILPLKNFNQLPRIFDIASTFTAKQGFNLITPIVFDIIDIGTTIFIHFGLVYSVLFNYTGLLLGIANTSLPLMTYERFRNRLHKSRSEIRSQELGN